jgi:hypothetical protein
LEFVLFQGHTKEIKVDELVTSVDINTLAPSGEDIAKNPTH